MKQLGRTGFHSTSTAGTAPLQTHGRMHSNATDHAKDLTIMLVFTFCLRCITCQGLVRKR